MRQPRSCFASSGVGADLKNWLSSGLIVGHLLTRLNGNGYWDLEPWVSGSRYWIRGFLRTVSCPFCYECLRPLWCFVKNHAFAGGHVHETDSASRGKALTWFLHATKKRTLTWMRLFARFDARAALLCRLPSFHAEVVVIQGNLIIHFQCGKCGGAFACASADQSH